MKHRYIYKDNEIYKFCCKCSQHKKLDEFHDNYNKKKKQSKYNKASYCKICANIWYKERYIRERNKRIEKQRIYNKTEQCKLNAKKRRQIPQNREKAYQWFKHRRKTNPAFKLSCNLRSRIWDALNGKAKSAKTMELLGCTVDEFVKYIESKWESGMNWNNYGYSGWHVDHIKPCAAFDLTQEEEQYKCFHYSNMQPKWAHENFIKNSFYEGEKQQYQT